MNHKVIEKETKNGVIVLTSTINANKSVCESKVSTNALHNHWTISMWYTEEEYQHLGIGKENLKNGLGYLLNKYGVPDQIRYMWDGTNAYVYEWMNKNFDAICDCPIAVQKTQSEDDWSSHIYSLNVSKVLKYFGVI